MLPLTPTKATFTTKITVSPPAQASGDGKCRPFVTPRGGSSQ